MRSFFIFLVLWNASTTSWSQRFVDHTEAAGIQHFFEVYEGMFGGGVAEWLQVVTIGRFSVC